MKRYNKAPLAFQGQKRNFIRVFSEELKKLCGDGTGWVIVDVFGGSGLLSHNAKYTCRNARVIYNDYDNYCARLANISKTEEIRKELLTLVNGYKIREKISYETKEKIINYLESKEKYLDFCTLSNYLLFSGKIATSVCDFRSSQLYNKVSLTALSGDGYLSGVEIINMCFTELMEKDFNGRVLYLLDPPYIRTEQGYYNQNKYFGFFAQMKLFDLMKPPFFFFTSNKSEIVEAIKNGIKYLNSIFDESEIFSSKNTVNKTSSYKDFLILKKDFI